MKKSIHIKMGLLLSLSCGLVNAEVRGNITIVNTANVPIECTVNTEDEHLIIAGGNYTFMVGDNGDIAPDNVLRINCELIDAIPGTNPLYQPSAHALLRTAFIQGIGTPHRIIQQLYCQGGPAYLKLSTTRPLLPGEDDEDDINELPPQYVYPSGMFEPNFGIPQCTLNNGNLRSNFTLKFRSRIDPH